MSWLKRLFGRSSNKAADVELSPETKAIFDRIAEYLEDENIQNDQEPEPLRSAIKRAEGCDEISGATGEFGRELTNPIPVNGPVGEIIYLSSLRSSSSGQFLLFHRLCSPREVDIYEIVSADATVWDVLTLDMYHPRKSRRAPRGYRLASQAERKSWDVFGCEYIRARFSKATAERHQGHLRSLLRTSMVEPRCAARAGEDHIYTTAKSRRNGFRKVEIDPDGCTIGTGPIDAVAISRNIVPMLPYLIRKDSAKWAEVVRRAGVEIE